MINDNDNDNKNSSSIVDEVVSTVPFFLSRYFTQK